MELPKDIRGGFAQALKPIPGEGQALTVSGTTVQSADFELDTKVISVYSTTDCYIEVGDTNVVATSADQFLPANTFMFISVADLADVALAAIQVSAGGTLYVGEWE